MWYFRIIQICVYLALIALGYGIYKLICPYIDKLEDWLRKKNYHKDWKDLPLAIVLIAYLFFFYWTTDEVRVVYIERSNKVYHLYKNCDKSHSKTTPTFQFEAKMKGALMCEDCEVVEDMKREEAKDRY
jgi:hypothetical protein